MDYDYRTRSGSSPYDPHVSMYRQPATSSSSASPHASSLYPKIGQHGQQVFPSTAAGRGPPYHHNSSASSSGTGIRVAIKPEYRITPPPPLSPQIREIPRSNFQFDFDLEKKILVEAEKENPNWGRLGLENLPLKATESPSSASLTVDPVVMKYTALGLNREAVPLAVANYGDNASKVREFVNAYTLLREMGFSSNSVAEALLMFDNDTDKALAHFLNNSS